MSNESLDNPFSWRSKLEDLNSLPGEPLDKNTAWVKLHNRLQKKGNRKKAGWYWATAACFFTALLAVWLLTGNKHAYVAKNNLQPKVQKTSVANTTTANGAVVIASPIKAEKKKESTLKVADRQKLPLLVNSPIDADTMTIDLSSSIKLTAQKMEPAKPDSVAMAATIAVSKKLRVVHINELDQSTDKRIEIAGNSTASVRKTVAASNESLSRFTISQNASDNILKIKLSPSN